VIVPDVEDDQRLLVVHAQRDGRQIHNAHAVFERLRIAQTVEAPGVRVLLGIVGVDAIDLGALDDHVRVDFHAAQRGRRVGREVGVARTASDDHDAPLFHVANGPQPDIRLGHLVHHDRGLDARRHADALQGVLQRQAVHHRGDHAHVVGGGLLHAVLDAGIAAPQVARAAHQRHLDAQIVHGLDLAGDDRGLIGIDAEALRSGQRFTAQFEDDATIAGGLGG